MAHIHGHLKLPFTVEQMGKQRLCDSVEGDRALSSVSLLPQSDLTTGRTRVLDFCKTLIGYRKDKTITQAFFTLVNDGTIPVHLTINISDSLDFVIEGLTAERELALGPSRRLNITACYSPKELRKCQLNITVTVHDHSAVNMANHTRRRRL